MVILIARAGNYQHISDSKKQQNDHSSLVLAFRPRRQPARSERASGVLDSKKHLNDGTSLVLALRTRRDSAI